LPLKRAAERVEVSDRPPRQDLVAAIETDQMLDLLRYREMPPTGRRSATRGMYGKATMLPSSRRMPCLRARLSGEPAHRPENVAGTPRGGKPAPRARVMNDFAPCTPAISRDP
jgi:hypothetical protein